MNAEQRQAFIDAVEAAFAEQGIDMYDGAQRLLRYMDRKRPMIEASCSREALNRYLEDDGEVAVAEIAKWLALIPAFGGIATQFVTGAVRDTAASMPKAPVGPPSKLTPESKREIIEKVSRLHASGVQLGIAQSRVAQQFGVGKRSVQSVWQKRKEIAEQPFQTMRDVWTFLEPSIAKAAVPPSR